MTNFSSLQDFDKKSIEYLLSIYEERIPSVTADPANGISEELEIVVANVSSISIRRLIVDFNTVKFCVSVGRTMTNANIHYTNVL